MEDYEIKAKALAQSFLLATMDFEKAKQCAKICVMEVISSCEYNNVESWNTEWWEKVSKTIDTI